MLVAEAGSRESDGGRRPTLLTFQKDAGNLVAIQLGQRELVASLTNLNAEVLARARQTFDVREGPAVVLPHVRDLVDKVIAESGVDRNRIRGVGMAIPGPVDFSTGHPLYPPVMPGWHDYPIREYLESEFGWPIYVDDDANAMAVAEQWTGLGRNVENYIFVAVTPGIRCGTVCMGVLYRGSDDQAGEIGHTPVVDNGVVCQCGRSGCLEAVAGASALALKGEEAARGGRSTKLAAILERNGSLKPDDLAMAMEQGDAYAVELVRNAGVTIGETLGVLVNFYNPRLIILGGGETRLVDHLLPSIREAIYRCSLPSATREIEIRRSTLGDDAALIGAAALFLGERFGLSTVARFNAEVQAYRRGDQGDLQQQVS
jgi:predicted NBD/HSP70 family sugar kinase